jgi:hypothetical protein
MVRLSVWVSLGSETSLGQAMGWSSWLRQTCEQGDKLESETQKRNSEERTLQDGAKQIDGGHYGTVAA